MKKMILILSLSLAFLGCEESGPSAKTTASAPSSEIESPIVDEPTQEQDPVVVDPNTVVFKIETSEPTQYQIRIHKMIPNVGYEETASIVFQGITSSDITTHSFVPDCQYKLLYIKQQTSTQSGFVFVRGSVTYTEPAVGSNFYIFESFN